MMADFIPTPTMGEILKEEFMEPMNLSADMQNDIDIRNLKMSMEKEIADIKPFQAVAI